MSSSTKNSAYVNGKPVWTADAPQPRPVRASCWVACRPTQPRNRGVSKSVGVNPREQKEVNEKLREYGVVGAMRFNSKGFLQATSREGRRRLWSFSDMQTVMQVSAT